jgi:hypothetical protein
VIRVFPALKADDPNVGEPCSLCGFAIRAGQRVVLIPKPETQEGSSCQAALSHATCALSGMKTPAGVIERIKDGDASPYAVCLAGGRQAGLQECGLSD